MDPQAFRDIPWELTLAETAEREGARKQSRTVVVTNQVTLYDLEVRNLTYRFADDVMTARAFTMKKNDKNAFAALLYSLLLRYGMPIAADAKEAIWQIDILSIQLRRGDALTVAFSVNR